MTRTAVVIATAVVLALAGAAPADAKIITLDNKSITNADSVAPGTLADVAPASSCASQKPTPGLASDDDARADGYSIPQQGPGTSCVHVTLDGGSCGANGGARAVAYGPLFDFDTPQVDYRGDSSVASSANPSRTFSYAAPHGGNAILVHGAGTSGLCANYSLVVRIAPNADTDPATGVGDTSATLRGTVNELDEESNFHFEYGPTTAYGDTTTPAGFIGLPDDGDKNVTRPVSGLQPGTVYHYRTVVDYQANTSFPAGTAVGNDQTFRTTADPTATTGAASDVSTGGATLNGTANPGGIATTLSFEYGKDTDYGTSTAPQAAGADFVDHPVSSAISGLEPGTTYHFRAVAKQGSTVVNGDDATFTTAALPAAPTGSDLTPAGAGPTAPVLDLAAPSFAQGPRLSPSRFKAAKGTRVSYSLSEPATVTFTVERAAPGRKVGGRCVAPSSRNRKAKKCVRFVGVNGNFSHAGAAGANSLRFTGSVGGKKLKPGSYRLVAVAADAAGNKSAAKRASFKIVR